MPRDMAHDSMIVQWSDAYELRMGWCNSQQQHGWKSNGR